MARFQASPDTFLVEEIPAYEPAGEGAHTFLWIEKRDLTTPEAIRRLARALAVPEADVGCAGMKDRHATTRQWLSAPGVDPGAVTNTAVDGVRVLAARRHGHKLRTGHLRGNRFEVVLRDLEPGEEELLATRFSALVRSGVPNRYGAQRFGAAGDNLAVGLAILRGERREPDRRKRRLMMSAVQAAICNRVLELRAEEGGLLRVRVGDILQTARGGCFPAEDVAREQARVDAGEVLPTAPLPGSRVLDPPPGSAARALEDRALRELGVERSLLEEVGRSLPGTRRPVIVRVTPGEPALAGEPPDGLRLRFSLPAGAYATVLVAALGVDSC